MVTTSDGYQFWLSVAKPATTSPDLKVLQGVRLSDSSVCYTPYYGFQCPELLDAPPGDNYIFAGLTVTNRTDRPEPLVVLFSYDILLLVPFGEFAQFGAATGDQPNAVNTTLCEDKAATYFSGNPSNPSASTFCVPFITDLNNPGQLPALVLYARSLCAGASLSTINQCELGPGQSTAVYVFWGTPIPESAPTRDVRAYFNGGQFPLTQIPTCHCVEPLPGLQSPAPGTSSTPPP